jgi:hypothetical protein
MTNSFVLSTVTAILMTGAVLIHIKHQHDTENLHYNETEADEFESHEQFDYNPNPKIANVLNHVVSPNVKTMTKRSLPSEEIEYSIEDKNPSMIDFPKREKVKEVERRE